MTVASSIATAKTYPHRSPMLDGNETYEGAMEDILVGIFSQSIPVSSIAISASALLAATPVLDLSASSAATAGNIRAAEITTTLTGVADANTIEAFASVVTSAVKSGNWCNAIMGKIDYSTAGSVAGTAGAVCAEIDLNSTSVGNSGAYCCFEAELNVAGTFIGTNNKTAFMIMNAWGDQVATWQTSGYVFVLEGLGTPASSHVIQVNTDQPTHALRVLIDGTPYFLLMTTVDNGTE